MWGLGKLELVIFQENFLLLISYGHFLTSFLRYLVVALSTHPPCFVKKMKIRGKGAVTVAPKPTVP